MKQHNIFFLHRVYSGSVMGILCWWSLSKEWTRSFWLHCMETLPTLPSHAKGKECTSGGVMYLVFTRILGETDNSGLSLWCCATSFERSLNLLCVDSKGKRINRSSDWITSVRKQTNKQTKNKQTKAKLKLKNKTTTTTTTPTTNNNNIGISQFTFIHQTQITDT